MLPQSADRNLPLASIFIASGLPMTVLLSVIFMVYACGLTNVIWPSPLDGGLVQTNENFMVLPVRGVLVCLQSPCCAATSLRSTISWVMQILTEVPSPPPGAPMGMAAPCLAIMDSIILRWSGGMPASCFCASAMDFSISPELVLILLLISHRPGLRACADAPSAPLVNAAAITNRCNLIMEGTPGR